MDTIPFGLTTNAPLALLLIAPSQQFITLHSSGYDRHGILRQPPPMHLPNTTLKTAAMFGQYTKNSWPNQPEYATFVFESGSPVYKWTPSKDGIMTINDSPDLKRVGHLNVHRVIGEMASKGTVLVLELEKASNA